VLLCAACSRRDFSSTHSAVATENGLAGDSVHVAALRDTLLRLGAEDQAGRDQIATAVAANDTAKLFTMLRADSARSRWLRAVVARDGWPRRSVVGDSAAGSAWLILQHSPFNDFQKAMLPQIAALVAAHDVSANDMALLTDRVLVHDGQKQRYGSQFDVKDGKLVAQPVEDLSHLDARRASLGLPPMAEYVKLMHEMFKVPVVWPPAQ
jgi:hypothetical protein